MSNPAAAPPVRVLALLEGTTVTGPAKNLLEFFNTLKSLHSGELVSLSAAAFVRQPRAETVASNVSNQLLEAAQLIGLEVHFIPERFPFDPQMIRCLRNLIARLNPDIIQTHHVKSHFLVRLSGVWRTCCWVAFHHGYTRDATRTLFYNQLDRWSLRAPSRIVTVCEPFKRQMVSIGVPPSRITVLHNAVSQRWLNGPGTNDTTRVIAPNGNERNLLAVGRLSEEKAFSDLIEAVAILRQSRPDLLARLTVVGDGPERSRLERLIQELHLQDRVSLTGHAPDVRPYYRAADVLVISSISEGSPNVLLEAMASGVPVVATSVGGIPEIVTDRETALLVEPRKPRQMGAAIQQLLTEPCLAAKLAGNARTLVSTRYSPEARSRFLIDLYRQICANIPAQSCMIR